MTEPSGSGGEKLVPRLGQLALQKGLVTQAQLDSALDVQERTRSAGRRVRPLGEILVAHGSLSPAQLTPLLQEANGAAPAPAATLPPAPSPEPKTRRKTPTAPFGKYQILREVGRGGKGVVHEALDTVLDRKVALKTIQSETLPDPKELEAEGRRFLIEARISASLPKHPHIVSVYEAGEIEGRRYLAMELIQGQSMMRWRRMSSITLPQHAGLIRDVALALDIAHKRGVVHRDIKPQNILVDREHQPHLTDFGLAKVTGQKEDLAHTIPGKVWGTPTYMSPEHAKGLANLDHRADVYSLGILLYEAIAGRPPFRSDKPSEILDKLVHEAPPPVAKWVDTATMSPLQRALEPVCMKALAKNPAGRHESAKAFADEISRCLGDQQEAPKKKKVLLLAGAAAAVIVAAIVVLVLALPGGANDLEQAQRLQVQQKYEEAAAAFDRALARDPSNTIALDGRKEALKKIGDRLDGEKRRAGEEARREERARSDASKDALEQRLEARRKADEEDALTQQARLMAQNRDAEERARLAEVAKKKAEDKLNEPAPAPTPVPVPVPVPAPAAKPTPVPAPPPLGPAAPAVPVPVLLAALTGEPKALEDGVLHFEAEDFSGGATPVSGTDYHDLTPGNTGRVYRQTDVDIGPLPEGGFFIGDIMPGEWLHYRFQGGGRYQIEIRYLGRQPTTIHLEIDGVNATGPVLLPPGADKRTWSTMTSFLNPLKQGSHELRFVFDTPPQGLDYFRLKPFVPAAAPEAAALREAEKTVRDAFKGDYAKRAPADLLALAKKLMAESAKQTEPATRFALLSESRDAAAQSGDIAAALTAIEELDRLFAIDATVMRTEVLASVAKVARTPEPARALAEAYLPVIEQAVEHDDYDTAMALSPKAEAAAKIAQSPNLVTRIQARTKEISTLRDEYRALKAALKMLEEKPEDPAANLSVGMYRCFSKGDWTHGAALLAKGSDPVLAGLGQKEQPPPGDAAAQAALGDAWREAGEKRQATVKTRFFTRALHWYEKALPSITNLGRVKIEGYVETLSKVVYGGQDTLRKGLVFWVEPGREPIDPFREHVFGSKVQNNGCSVTDAGARSLLFNVGQANRGWIEYPAVDAVKSIEKSGAMFAWIKTDTVDVWGGIVNRGGANEQVDDFGLWVGRGALGAWFNYPDNRRRMSSKGMIPVNKWTLVGVCWDERNAIFYIDGKEDSVHPLTAIEQPQRRNSRISIGSNPPGGQDPYSGLVGSVMIYNRPLAAAEVSLLYMGTRLKFR